MDRILRFINILFIIICSTSSRILFDISDMFFIFLCIADLYFISVTISMSWYLTKLSPDTSRSDTVYQIFYTS